MKKKAATEKELEEWREKNHWRVEKTCFSCKYYDLRWCECAFIGRARADEACDKWREV